MRFIQPSDAIRNPSLQFTINMILFVHLSLTSMNSIFPSHEWKATKYSKKLSLMLEKSITFMKKEILFYNQDLLP
jgi:hypothetical protein